MIFQFAEASDLASKAIQIFERGWPSHVDIVLGNGSLLGARDDVCMGVPKGVQIRPPGYYPFSRTERISLTATGDQETAFLNFLMNQIGKPYDVLAIVAFTVERDWREDDSWFCSELAAAALEACHWFPQTIEVPANELTPRDLYAMVSPWRVV